MKKHITLAKFVVLGTLLGTLLGMLGCSKDEPAPGSGDAGTQGTAQANSGAAAKPSASAGKPGSDSGW